MLRTEFPTNIAINLGALMPPIKDQVEAAGMLLDNHEMWERRHQAWNLLRIGGFLTETEVKRIGRRLMRGIAQDAHFDTAKAELGAEILQELHIKAGSAEPATPESSEGETVCVGEQGGELDRYIGMSAEVGQP
jgi:hypothetical protein